MAKKMLILRGIAGHFDGKDWPKGALYEEPALEYARRRGYIGIVLDISGEASYNSRQVREALPVFSADPEFVALYGFSGGGYNINHILSRLEDKVLARIELVVVIGAPKNPSSYYYRKIGNSKDQYPWELVYRKDPPQGHMYGPQALLNELGDENPPGNTEQ